MFGPARKHSRNRGRCTLVLLATALGLRVEGARAEEPKAEQTPENSVSSCLEAHREAQRLLRSGALLDAKAAMSKCASPSCPALVQTDCAAWVMDIERDIPSVVLRVLVDGVERTDVKVEMNGAELVDVLGRPLPLDPGSYEFEFEVGGFGPQRRSVTLVAREKYKLVTVDFNTPRTTPDQTVPPRAGKIETKAATAPERPVPLMTWVLGGIGVAGVGGFAVLAATTVSRESSLRDRCEPECDQADVDALKTRYLLADISLGVGAAALAGAAVFYFTRPEVGSEKGGVALVVQPNRAGVSAAVEAYGF